MRFKLETIPLLFKYTLSHHKINSIKQNMWSQAVRNTLMINKMLVPTTQKVLETQIEVDHSSMCLYWLALHNYFVGGGGRLKAIASICIQRNAINASCVSWKD